MVAFRGTEGSLADWWNNIRQGTGAGSSQYSQAVDLAQQVHAATGGNVVFVGHSLGGGLATAAAAATGGRAVIFNAAGYASFRGAANIRSHLVRGGYSEHAPRPHAPSERVGY